MVEDVKVLHVCIPVRSSVRTNCYVPGLVGIVELLAALLVPTFVCEARIVPRTPATCMNS